MQSQSRLEPRMLPLKQPQTVDAHVATDVDIIACVQHRYGTSCIEQGILQALVTYALDIDDSHEAHNLLFSRILTRELDTIAHYTVLYRRSNPTSGLEREVGSTAVFITPQPLKMETLPPSIKHMD